jgi:pSer/pThr/pTyr-binding forkhead associated (FHA) protein
MLYDDASSYIEECKINENAKSDILVSAACNCQTDANQKQSPNHTNGLAETLKSSGVMIKFVTGELKLPENGNGSTEKSEADNSSLKLAVLDANSELRKYYDFAKRTWHNFIQPQKKPQPPHHRSRPPPFKPPSWASPLTTQKGIYVLQVIKNHKHIDSIPFTQNGKMFFLLGRSAEMCDIELANPLISRQHAAVVFNKEEEPYIIDLNSAHGTFVDDAKLEPYTPMPLQEGSLLKFGTSARKYLLLRKPPNTNTELLRSENKEEATLDSEDADGTQDYTDQSPSEDISWDSNEPTSKKRDPMSISSLLGGQEEAPAEELDSAFFVTKKPRSQ